jgi:acyl carrier protein
VVLAEHLFHAAGARLALLVPRDAPPRHKWEEWLGAHDETEEEVRRMRRLLALETAGCELLVLPYELTRADRVKVAVERVRERFGAVHGVIHAAGEDGAGLLQWKSREAAQAVLAPKVQGTLALAAAVRGLDLDFFVLCGSRAAVLGGFGQGDTCAAASFLDAFAQGEPGLPVQTVDWDFFRWQPITANDPALAEQLRRGLDAYGINARECAEVFDRVLASPLPQVAVATQDLDAQLGTFSAADLLDGLAKNRPGTAHARPDLATPYSPPESEIESSVAAVWQEAFGIEPVGIHDNFFDLAGNSLLAVQIVSRLATSFGIKLSITSLLEAPTVAELSQRIGEELTASLPAEVDEAEMERLLREIEALSSEEAQARLAGDVNP